MGRARAAARDRICTAYRRGPDFSSENEPQADRRSYINTSEAASAAIVRAN